MLGTGGLTAGSMPDCLQCDRQILVTLAIAAILVPASMVALRVADGSVCINCGSEYV